MDEAALENLAMAWLGELGYETAHGPDIIDERGNLQEVILWGRFEAALERINPQASNAVLSQAVRQFRRRLSEDASIVRCNREFQRMLIEGIPIELDPSLLPAAALHNLGWDDPWWLAQGENAGEGDWGGGEARVGANCWVNF